MSPSAGPTLAQLASRAAARWPSPIAPCGASCAPPSAFGAEIAARVPEEGWSHPAGHEQRPTYSFVCPNRTVSWRVTTFLTKEPETIEWIDTFAPGDVLFDIGANIGCYSIYAASRSVRVMAFEPESQNYALINQNIFLNG